MQGLSHAAAPEMNKFSIVAHCNTSVMSVVRCGTTSTRCVQTCSVSYRLTLRSRALGPVCTLVARRG